MSNASPKPPEPDTDRFYSTREVAALLRLTERTVYELVRERQIPTVRVAGKWLFPRDLLERWGERKVDKLLEQIAFEAPDREGDTLRIDAAEVDAKLGALVKDEDLSRYIL